MSQKVFLKSFCISHPSHKSVNLFFTLVTVKDTLTDLCGSCPMQNDFKITLSKLKLGRNLRGMRHDAQEVRRSVARWYEERREE